MRWSRLVSVCVLVSSSATACGPKLAPGNAKSGLATPAVAEAAEEADAKQVEPLPGPEPARADAPAETTPEEPGPLAIPGGTVIVTGANRGLGLEFARQLKARGYDVIGTARKPGEAKELKALGVRVEQLDVTDAKSIARFAKRIEGSVDILINNAGISVDPFWTTMPQNRNPNLTVLEQTNLDDLEEHLVVNTVGPLRVTVALLPQLRKGKKKAIITMSSSAGSFGLSDMVRNVFAEHAKDFIGYNYRTSKAALNFASRLLAVELDKEGFICALVQPEWARTGMGGPTAPMDPVDSIRNLIGVIESLTRKHNGAFLYQGKDMPW